MGIQPEEAMVQLLGGGIAGCIAWLSIYPIDVIKSRLQTQSIQALLEQHHRGGSVGKATTVRYSGFFDCLKKSVKAEGWSVLSKGLGITMVRG